MADDISKRIFREDTYTLLDKVFGVIYTAYKDIDLDNDDERREFTDMVYGVSLLFPLKVLMHISGDIRFDNLFEEWVKNVQSLYSSSRDLEPEPLANGGTDTQF